MKESEYFYGAKLIFFPIFNSASSTVPTAHCNEIGMTLVYAGFTVLGYKCLFIILAWFQGIYMSWGGNASLYLIYYIKNVNWFGVLNPKF